MFCTLESGLPIPKYRVVLLQVCPPNPLFLPDIYLGAKNGPKGDSEPFHWTVNKVMVTRGDRICQLFCQKGKLGLLYKGMGWRSLLTSFWYTSGYLNTYLNWIRRPERRWFCGQIPDCVLRDLHFIPGSFSWTFFMVTFKLLSICIAQFLFYQMGIAKLFITFITASVFTVSEEYRSNNKPCRLQLFI